MTEASVAGIRADVEREQWALLLDNARALTLPSALVGALFAAFFSYYAALPGLWLWWLVLASVLALRWRLLRRWAARDRPLQGAARVCFHLLLVAVGLLWGAAPLLVVRQVDDIMLFTGLLIATGIAVASFATYGIRQSAALAVTLPIGVLSLVALTRTAHPAYFAIGVALILLYTHQLVIVRRARDVLETQIRLRVENEVLVQELSARAERTAAELDRRMDTERNLRASRDRAERLSATDGLTEIANRRYFDRRLRSEISRAFRERSPLSLVLSDIDYFKQFNDAYGHQRGDECLKAFARVLERYCRRGGDLAARIGGEEFALLLPSTDHEAALKLAEQARRAFAALAIEHSGSQTAAHVTASFGVSTLVPDDLEAGELLQRHADRALYTAKAEGRDRVVSERGSLPAAVAAR